MAGPNLSDQSAEDALALLDLYRSTGLVRQRVGWAGDGVGKLAKLSGQTAEAVTAQLDGSVPPTPGQARALVRALRMAGDEGAALAASNGKAG
jgi:hypothetical protein